MVHPTAIEPPASALRARPIAAAASWRAVVALTKPRLATLSVLTTAVAFAAAHPEWNLRVTIALFVGTALSAAGALALNQWRERDSDRVMRRTSGRPLPQQQLTPNAALVWSTGFALVGVTLLAFGVNLLAAALSAATIVIYAFIYTPLKRRTRWATEIGAISGALPPLIGWAAAENRIGPLGLCLFGLIFFWQMPHFFAIGWVCRDDYRAARFPLLPAVDATGVRTAGWSFAHTIALLAWTTGTVALGLTGPAFAVVSLAVGGFMLWRAGQFALARPNRDVAARKLFLASLIYLPLVLLALILDRAWP